MPATFNCPTCGAPLHYPGSGETVSCPYCTNSVIVPEEIRPKGGAFAPSTSPYATPLSTDQLANIKQCLRDQKKIEAIKIYRQVTHVGLKEAKDAVEAIQAADPELKNLPPTPHPVQSKFVGILVGLLFLAVAAIFPIVFFPLGIESWQSQEYGGAIFSFLAAIIWALVWGSIGVLTLVSSQK